MKVVNPKGSNFLKGQSEEGLFGPEKETRMSPELERLAAIGGVDPDLLKRARDREEEERDLRVLDAYNRFESGLYNILADPKSGIMQLRAGDAQSAVFEVNDYFTEEGNRLCDELPDDDCRSRFMDILESRRKTALDAVARHQSQEYQNWKESTAAATIDSVLKGVKLSPDSASLMHGELLLEGAILRLYRSSNLELTQLRLIAAKQSMYAGALETIGANDPISALIMVDSWKEQLGEEYYEQLLEKFKPLARNQSIKQEFYSLRGMDDEQIEAELKDLKDEDMRREISEMLSVDRELRARTDRIAQEEQRNAACRELFKKFVEGVLSTEDILDSGLDAEMRSLWLLIFGRKGEKGSDEALMKVVNGLICDAISEERQIYAAIVGGLGEMDAALLIAMFEFRDNPESRLAINGLREISERGAVVSCEVRDLAAAVRDFLNRVAALIAKGEPFSVTRVRNEVIADHFTKGQGGQKPDGNAREQDFSEVEDSAAERAETNFAPAEDGEDEAADETTDLEKEQVSKKNNEEYSGGKS
jgi:hypothetical protein